MSTLIQFFGIFWLSLGLNTSKVQPPLVFSKAEILNETTTRIPFKIIDQLIVVEAELYDMSGNFIIDTGSESLVLNSVHFKPKQRHKDVGIEKSGIHSDITNIKQQYLKALSLDNLSLKQINADILDLSTIEKTKRIQLLGIIGYSILKDFEVFIDLHLNQITLTKTDRHGNHLSDKVYAEHIQDSITFKLRKHTIVLDAKVGGRAVKFGLDTAAEYNQLNKSVNPIILSYFYPNKTIKLTGVSGKQLSVLSGKLYRVSLSDSIYFGPMKTVVTNLRKMNSVFTTGLDGILGFEFFAQKRTIINYKKRKLYFMKRPIISN